MRLICPSCGAQYDVPPGAIPPEGRDVQCSACGRTWFERPLEAGGATEPEPWDQVPRPSDDEEEADDLAEAQVAPPPLVDSAAPRSTVTAEVAEILRAEAAREAQARDEEATRLVVPAAERPAPPAAPMPMAEAEDAPFPARAPLPSETPRPEPLRSRARPARSPERELDIDRINSSLRTANDRYAGKAPQIGRPRKRGGFAAGFGGALLILALLAGLYVLAPRITAAVPGAAAVLDPYVAAVNQGRAWLDRQVGAVLGARPE